MKIKITDGNDVVLYEAVFFGGNRVYAYTKNSELLDFVQKMCLDSNDNIENFIKSSKNRKANNV